MNILDKKRILVTRPDEAGESLARALAAAGALPLYAPALRMSIDPANPAIEEARRTLGGVQRLLVTSRYGLVALLANHAVVDQTPGVWAVGRQTAEMARKAGFSIAVAAEQGGISGLVDLILANDRVRDIDVLWPCGDLSEPGPAEALAARGVRIRRIPVYRTLNAYETPGGVPKMEHLSVMEAVVFASPSAVKHLGAALSPDDLTLLQLRMKTIVIGETTGGAAVAAGWQRIVVADRPSNDGLIAALESAFLPA